MNDEYDSSAGCRRRPQQRTPLQQALALLVRREYSQRELTRKLKARGVDEASVEAALERLIQEGWQDDQRFAESLVRTRIAAGYGPLHLRAELMTHGLGEEAFQAALVDIEGSWSARARELIQRRFGEHAWNDRTWQRKAADLLARRGFDTDSIRAATRLDRED